MSNTDELFDNNFSFISSFISLQSIYALTFWGALTFGRRLLLEGAYYRSLISSLQQMRLLLGGAYYRGALIIGSLRYMFKTRNDLSISNDENEHLCMEIIKKQRKNTIVNTCYRPPGSKVKPFKNM